MRASLLRSYRLEGVFASKFGTKTHKTAPQNCRYAAAPEKRRERRVVLSTAPQSRKLRWRSPKSRWKLHVYRLVRFGRRSNRHQRTYGASRGVGAADAEPANQRKCGGGIRRQFSVAHRPAATAALPGAGELHAEMAQPTQADDGHSVTRDGFGDTQGVVGSNARAGHRCCFSK